MSIFSPLASALEGSLAVKGISASAFNRESDQTMNIDDAIVVAHPVCRQGEVKRSSRAKQHNTRDGSRDNSRLIRR